MSTTTWRGVDAPFLPNAACTAVDPELFHVKLTPAAVTRAKRVCASCPDRWPCLRWALERDERLGVWGGTTPAEREAIRAELDKGVPLIIAADRLLQHAAAEPAPVPRAQAAAAPVANQTANVRDPGPVLQPAPSPSATADPAAA
jgi:WhiB family redox-sensing transcriptional regulator